MMSKVIRFALLVFILLAAVSFAPQEAQAQFLKNLRKKTKQVEETAKRPTDSASEQVEKVEATMRKPGDEVRQQVGKAEDVINKPGNEIDRQTDRVGDVLDKPGQAVDEQVGRAEDLPSLWRARAIILSLCQQPRQPR